MPAVAAACLKEGVIILTCGTYGNVIRLLPPLVITDELLNDGLDVLAAADHVIDNTRGGATPGGQRCRLILDVGQHRVEHDP